MVEDPKLDANKPGDPSNPDPSDPSAGTLKPEPEGNVPFHEHPRWKEMMGKLEEKDNQISSMQTQIQNFQDQIGKMSAPTTTETPEVIISKMPTQELYNAEIIASDISHERYEDIKPHLPAIKAEIRKRERNEVTQTLFSQDQKRQSEARALNKYNQFGIADTKSEFYQKTRERLGLMMNTLRQAGVDEEKIKSIPTLLEDAADRTALELGLVAETAKSQGQMSEYDRQLSARRAGVDMGQQTGKKKEAAPIVTDRQRAMSLRFGVNPENVAKRKEKFYKSGMVEDEK